jgi:hypothetical protein
MSISSEKTFLRASRASSLVWIRQQVELHRSIRVVPDHAGQARMTPLLECFEAGIQTMVGMLDAGRLRHQVVDLSVDENDAKLSRSSASSRPIGASE